MQKSIFQDIYEFFYSLQIMNDFKISNVWNSVLQSNFVQSFLSIYPYLPLRPINLFLFTNPSYQPISIYHSFL